MAFFPSFLLSRRAIYPRLCAQRKGHKEIRKEGKEAYSRANFAIARSLVRFWLAGVAKWLKLACVRWQGCYCDCEGFSEARASFLSKFLCVSSGVWRRRMLRVIVLVLTLGTCHLAPRPKWITVNGVTAPICPTGWMPYASEHELAEGKTFTHCVRW